MEAKMKLLLMMLIVAAILVMTGCTNDLRPRDQAELDAYTLMINNQVAHHKIDQDEANYDLLHKKNELQNSHHHGGGGSSYTPRTCTYGSNVINCM